MFSIFNRTPTITLDCFTPIPDLPELFPLKKASGIVPNWWKNLKPTVEYKGINRGSLKMCPGVTDYFKTGFIITCWRDETLYELEAIWRHYFFFSGPLLDIFCKCAMLFQYKMPV